MKLNKLFLFFIVISIILSITSVSAVDDSINGLFVENNVDQLESQDIISSDVADELQSQDIVSSDADEEKLESSSSELDDVLKVENANEPVQSIKMGKVTKRYNGAIEYQATFYDESGNPLTNTKVLFEVDDNNDYEATTDSKGVALLTVLISNGNHKIAAFNPETYNISYADIKVFDVLKGGKNLKMYYDGGNTYSVRVYGDDGKPVKAGQKVTFYLGKSKYTRSTDKNGYAKFKITAKPGYYEIAAKYKDFAVSNTVTVKQVLKPLTSFKNRAVKKTIQYKVKFLGKNKKGKTIKVKFNKKTYKAKTNKKGVAVFKLKTPKKVGSYKLVTSYKKTKVTSLYSKYYA